MNSVKHDTPTPSTETNSVKHILNLAIDKNSGYVLLINKEDLNEMS